MKRRILLATGAALIGGLGWLTTSESGLQTAASLAERASGGQLQIEQASGRLLGSLDIGQLRWQDADLKIEASQTHLDWSPAALLHGTLDIAELRVDALRIVSAPSDTATRPPGDLQLNLTVNAKKVQILKLSVDAHFTATESHNSDWQFSSKTVCEFSTWSITVCKYKDAFEVSEQTCVVFLPTVCTWYSNTRYANTTRHSKGIKFTFAYSYPVTCSFNV